MPSSHVPLVVLVSSVAAASSSGQVARALLREGDELPAVGVGHTVDRFFDTAVNQAGGYGALMVSTDGLTDLSHVWGSPDGSPGAILRSESTIGVLEQQWFEFAFGISDAGNVAYSPLSLNTMTLEGGLDGVWLDDTVLALEGDPIPSLPGKRWSWASGPGVTADGQPYWRGGIEDAATGASEGMGLFFGSAATLLYESGDSLAPLPFPLGPEAVQPGVRFSALGSHHIAEVETVDAKSYLVVDGAVLTLGGNLVGEDEPIAASAGGLPGERWTYFRYLGITESGKTMFSGGTDGPPDANEVLVKNGQVLYREGQSIGGLALTGSVGGASMNESGDVAFIWWVEDEGGEASPALFLGGQRLAREGDGVDLDGDCVADAGATLATIGSPTLGPDRVVYFLGDVDTQGTSGTFDDADCLLAITPSTLEVDAEVLSVSTGGSAAFELCGGAENAGRPYLVLGSASGIAPGIVFDQVRLPLNVDPYFILTLTIPNSSIHVGTLGVLSAEGTGSAALILPPTNDPSLPGFDLAHAFATVDPATGAVAFASNPVSTLLVP